MYVTKQMIGVGQALFYCCFDASLPVGHYDCLVGVQFFHIIRYTLKERAMSKLFTGVLVEKDAQGINGKRF